MPINLTNVLNTVEIFCGVFAFCITSGGNPMDHSFEIRTEKIPADYNEMMAILCGPELNSKSHFIEAATVRKSSVKI